MEEVIITAIVFTGIYQIIKVFTDFLLKRKIIRAGHLDPAGILDAPKSREENAYPTLKWGLVTLFAGIGLLIIAVIEKGDALDFMHGRPSYLPIGIELMTISLGFLLYFTIMRFMQSKSE